jgi:hypothetical protein
MVLKKILVTAAQVVLIGAFLSVEEPATAEPAIQLDERRAFGYLEEVCKIGPRPSASEGMTKQQDLIVDHFTKLGAQVGRQDFNTAHPKKGTPVRMTNLIVSWHPQAKERVLLCCHYDTRPFPDRDQDRPKGPFIGANDGGSGVALFMEMAHSLPKIQPTFGVDMVFFDGEEFIFQRDGGKFFLGSEHFAQQYRGRPPPYRYACGVLVDMIGDKRLTIPMEPLSQKWAPKVVRSVWETARELGIKEFVSKPHPTEINDDHVPLNEIAKIPTADLIDFDYPAWHTTNDKPSQCSGASLVKVARVLLTWLQQVPEDVGR